MRANYFVSPDGTCATARPCGEIDCATAADFTSLLQAAGCETSEVLVVDCADVTFMDSSGMGGLVGEHRALDKQGKRLVVINVNATILRSLRIVGAHRIFEVEGLSVTDTTLSVP